jgi:TRAP-type C4-dicarboxylate transport system permease large subunit
LSQKIIPAVGAGKSSVPHFLRTQTSPRSNYGVLMCRVSEMGFISPPFGLNLFGLVGVIDVPLSKMYRGVIPFLVADMVHLALLIAIPAISLFIPNLMK